MPMKKELRDKWVAALRSGKYKQSHGVLHNTRTGGYCCLGVFCVVAELPEWNGEQIIAKYSSSTSIPLHIAERVGLEDEEQNNLISMNDAQNKSFQEIADYIEQNIPVEGE